MSKLIFIVGGCRSGKTSYAIKLAKAYKKVVYLATAQTLDEEMVKRAKKHRQNRPAHWMTIEEPLNLKDKLLELDTSTDIVIIDCLTLYLSNLIFKEKDDFLDTQQQDKVEKEITKNIRHLLQVTKKIKPIVVIISNDTGLGIVPADPLSRFFRDMSGFINQITADQADEVYKMEVGIPIKIK